MCDIDEGPEFQRDTWRRARKQHNCCACKHVVQSGEHYMNCFGKWDGEVDTYRYCARCWAFVQAVLKNGDGYIHGLACGVDWGEAFNEDPPEAVAALAFMTPTEIRELGELRAA